MRLVLFAVALGALARAASGQERATPRHGLVISRTVVLRPGIYSIEAPASLDSAAIVVRGRNVTVDLHGVELRGSPTDAEPDRAGGVAILVDGGENITIKNARIRGYKIAIRAVNTKGLRLLDNDLSSNWKPRLYSIVEHESLADWLSFHHNEKDEWLRYGAAMHLLRVHGGEIRGNTVQQGMNGLLLTGTDSLLIWNNDFSFNSGLGIGMYRSSHNRVMHNRVDYNVRGYSEGFYRRGQDSAGILMYEQSDSNLVAYNSVTHGGDGLFIWAGQSTMDTGLGGVNDNVIYGNDFSWAPTNGMEATFSRNTFARNRVVGSDYGLWGGYSYSSTILGNAFQRNRIGVAIEHGQDNSILSNTFAGDSLDLYLWANKIEPGDWGYPKHRDTRSRDYLVANNTMSGARLAIRLGDTHGARIRDNDIQADTLLSASGDTSGIVVARTPTGSSEAVGRPALDIRPMAEGRRVLPSAFADAPRSTIVVDEWGPYDWRAPKLWPVDSSLSTPLRLRVLGPTKAPWRVVSVAGATVSRQRGTLGDTFTVSPIVGRVEDWTVVLSSGGRQFSYSRFDARPAWAVRVFAWDDSTHPLKAAREFSALLRGEQRPPVLSLTATRIDYVWFRPRVAGWPLERVGVAASADIDLPPGRYLLRTISDDGIRVFVDDALVIEDWTVHESRVLEAPISPGRHRLRVEYFQLDGWTELQVGIIKQR